MVPTLESSTQTLRMPHLAMVLTNPRIELLWSLTAFSSEADFCAKEDSHPTKNIRFLDNPSVYTRCQMWEPQMSNREWFGIMFEQQDFGRGLSPFSPLNKKCNVQPRI